MMFRRFVCIFLVTAGLWACSSTPKEDQLLLELSNMDKDSIFQKAEDLFTSGKIKESRKYFSFISDTFPNDPLGHKASLRVADTYAKSKDTASVTEARLRYKDFANRYPNDPDRDYALLMVGQTYSSRHLRPDRDLSTLHEALDAYEQLINLYPNSGYYDEASARISELKDILATHEYQVAVFYARNKRWLATQWRLDYIKKNYPDYKKMDEVDALEAKAGKGAKLAEEEFKKYMAKRAKSKKDATSDTSGEKTSGEGSEGGENVATPPENQKTP